MTQDLNGLIQHISERLDAIDAKLESLSTSRRKSMEWIGQLSEQIMSLDSFREEVRATIEPLFGKLETVEDGLRVLRHATSDVSRKVEEIGGVRRAAG